MKITRTGLLLLTLLSVSSLSWAGLKPGTRAPSFTLTRLDGPQLSLQDMTTRGHVMLVFWETECVYCFMHIGELNQLHQRYHAKGLTIAAIDFLGEHEDAIRQYATNNQVQYLMLTDRTKSIDVASDYQVIGSPTIVVIGPDGNILFYGHDVPDIGRWIK